MVLHLKNTTIDSMRAVKWQSVLLPGMLVLQLTFTLGSKYLLPAIQVHFLTLYNCSFRTGDLSLNNVWSTGLEDSATLRASDVKSPLPFTTHFHSTPNYWHEKQGGQHNQQFNQLHNQSYIPHNNNNQNSKQDTNSAAPDNFGYEFFSPLPPPSANSRSRASERSSISSYTSQSSQHSSDTDSYLELQSIADNMEKCNLFNNNYMFESQLHNDLSSKSSFQPFVCDTVAKSVSSSFCREQPANNQPSNLKMTYPVLGNFLAKRALSFGSQTRQSFQDTRQVEECQNDVNRQTAKGLTNQRGFPESVNTKSVFRPVVNPKTEFASPNSVDNLQNIVTSTNFHNPSAVDLRQDFKPIIPAENFQNNTSVAIVTCIQNPTTPASASNIIKPQDQKPFNTNIFQPVKVLTRSQTASSSSVTSDQGWSNPSTPGSLQDATVNHSERTTSQLSSPATQQASQKQPNFVPVSMPSKAVPPMFRHSFPLGIQPRFGPIQVDPHLLPVDPKFLLEPMLDKRYSVPNLVRTDQVMNEMMSSPQCLERKEDRVPIQSVPPPQIVKYPATKIPLFVPAGIPHQPLPGEYTVPYCSVAIFEMLHSTHGGKKS